MPLNARQVETAKPRDKAYKLADGGGLYLMVNTNGSKYWRMKYRFAGKEKKLSFGTYPDISLAEARTKRDEARKVLANDKDPGEIKKAMHLLEHKSEILKLRAQLKCTEEERDILKKAARYFAREPD